MSVEDRQRWNDRHGHAPTTLEPHGPTALARSGVTLPPTGRALDVACGRGSVSSWLAMQGLEVIGVDVSAVAVAAAQDLAVALQVADSTSFEVFDLDDGLPEGVFDVVVCQRFRDPARYRELAAAVASGGLLVITVLSNVGHDGDPGPFRAAPGELVAAFDHVLDVLWSSEGDGEAHLVARR